MQQEQPPSSGQNSAQNPPPTPSSSSSISPHDEEDIGTNTNGNLHVEPEEGGEEENHASIAAAKKEQITLPILGNSNTAATTTTANDEEDLTNPSPYTNLSRHAITNEMVFGPIPDREYHEGFMRKAIEMAQLALDSDEGAPGPLMIQGDHGPIEYRNLVITPAK